MNLESFWNGGLLALLRAVTPLLLVFTLSTIAIVYTSLVALMQEDMKKLIAYSSVAHMGFVTMGIFAGTMQGAAGGVFQMISHGIVSGALFLCVGIVYDRMHTREIAAHCGLVTRMTLYALVFPVFPRAIVGLPGTPGLVGEFRPLLGPSRVPAPTPRFAPPGWPPRTVGPGSAALVGG